MLAGGRCLVRQPGPLPVAGYCRGPLTVPGRAMEKGTHRNRDMVKERGRARRKGRDKVKDGDKARGRDKGKGRGRDKDRRSAGMADIPGGKTAVSAVSAGYKQRNDPLDAPAILSPPLGGA
jgi:hypothetical protein